MVLHFGQPRFLVACVRGFCAPTLRLFPRNRTFRACRRTCAQGHDHSPEQVAIRVVRFHCGLSNSCLPSRRPRAASRIRPGSVRTGSGGISLRTMPPTSGSTGRCLNAAAMSILGCHAQALWPIHQLLEHLGEIDLGAGAAVCRQQADRPRRRRTSSCWCPAPAARARRPRCRWRSNLSPASMAAA